MENNEQNSQKNITDKWLDNIFTCLMRLEEYERLAKEGCRSLLDYMQQGSSIDLADLQYKNYSMFLTEVGIIMNNVKNVIPKTDFLRIKLLLDDVKKIEKDWGGFLEIRINQIVHEETNYLNDGFYHVIDHLSKIRGILISSLWPMLSPKANENVEGFPQ